MKKGIIVISVLYLLTIGLGAIALIRNNRTLEVRNEINEMCFNYSISHNDNAYLFCYRKLPTYDEMFLSFRKLDSKSILGDKMYNKLTNKMKDINGVEIEVGMTVKTQQQSGGIISPAPAQIGEVVLKDNKLVLKFKKENYDFNFYILLEGKINEIIK